MKLAGISAFAEIVSSVAIVLTLIYLTIETGQNTEAELANSRQATMLADVSYINALISNPEATLNQQRPVSELNPMELEQVGNIVAGYFRIREFAWFQYQNGILDEATWNSYMAPTVSLLQLEAIRYWWNIFVDQMDPEFALYVNALIENDSN